MPRPIQKVLCGSIDRDVPAERVQTLLELRRLVEDLDDLELPTVVQFALAQQDLTLVGRFRALRLIGVDKEDARPSLAGWMGRECDGGFLAGVQRASGVGLGGPRICPSAAASALGVACKKPTISRAKR
jgi:hypothetical protein